MAIVNAAVSAGVVTEGPSTSEVTTGPRRRLTQTQTPPATSKCFVKNRAYIGHILLESFFFSATCPCHVILDRMGCWGLIDAFFMQTGLQTSAVISNSLISSMR